ncbi:MAG: hypothetical protein JNL98_28325 [Bryobacterales bacterium]|nr:hypothetical protein [Bryobacterales bacterium]
MQLKKSAKALMAMTVILSSVAVGALAKDHENQQTSMFQGPKANTGTALFMKASTKRMVKVSPDFKVPDTPAPTWRLIDTKGNIYTFDAFKIKGGEKREIEVPAYVPNIAKVQVYCAFAEVVLGEASFSTPAR